MGVFWSFVGAGSAILLTLIILDAVLAFYPFEFYLDRSKDFFYDLERNLNGSLYYSFSLQPTCTDGETPIDLGTFNGCINNKRFVSNTSCQDLTVGKTISQQLYKWNSSYICARKSKHNYRYLLTNKSFKSECSSNEKYCGHIDTQNRKFCVPVGDECPLTLKNFQSNNYKLSSLKEDNEQIFSIFKFSQGTPCINPNETEWNYPKASALANQHCQTKVKNQISDDRYHQIKLLQSITQYKLYEDHLINNSLSINDIDAYKGQDVYLYARNFIAFDEETANDFSYEKIISKIEDIKDNHKVMQISLYVLAAPIVYVGGITGAGASGSGGGGGKGMAALGMVALGISGVYAIPVLIINFVAAIKIFCHHSDLIDMFKSVTDEYVSQIIETTFIKGSEADRRLALAAIIFFPIVIVASYIVCVIGGTSGTDCKDC